MLHMGYKLFMQSAMEGWARPEEKAQLSQTQGQSPKGSLVCASSPDCLCFSWLPLAVLSQQEGSRHSQRREPRREAGRFQARPNHLQ